MQRYSLGWYEHPLTPFEALADIGYKAMHVSQAYLRRISGQHDAAEKERCATLIKSTGFKLE